MLQIAQTLKALDARKQVIVAGAFLAMFAGVYFLARIAAQPSMSLLYSGLENGPAGEVVRALEQRGVAYEVRGGAIFVPGDSRDELRLTLASEGLPANSSKGYELLDSLTGFGTTSQMFDAAYWRAKEGELARTILSSPEIRSARVHIANATANPFQRDLRPSASIAVSANAGVISPARARALRFLVASAVAGLSPNDVAVIDADGGLIADSGETAQEAGGSDRARAMREKVLRLLEARVGAGNAVVEVAVETVTESEAIRETRFDPDSRVAISTDTEERSNSESGGAQGAVTVASNLPDGDASGDQSQSQNSETRERVNYEVSQTEREIVRAPGAIKKLSVAVLVNNISTTGAGGEDTIAPLAEEELSALQELVASAVGFDEARGDTITVKSMSFTPIGTEGTPATAGFLSGFAPDIMSIVQMGVVALVTLVLGFGVVRPILSARPDQTVAALPSGFDIPVSAPDAESAVQPALDGEIDDGSDNFAPMIPETSPNMDLDFSAEDPIERLRNLIDERQDETVEVLRGWLDEKGEKV